MHRYTLGFVSIIRTTFDVSLATKMTARALARLETSGFAVVTPQAPVTSLEEADAAVALLAGQTLDLLVILQATFADSAATLAMAGAVDAPLLLWALPEPHTGGRLRLNSLCGINLAGHALTRAGYRYAHLYAAPGSAEAAEKIETVARAGHVRRLLRGAKIGRVGEHPLGFETCDYDAAALCKRFGVEVVPVELQDTVFAGARSADPAAVSALAQDVRARVSTPELVDESAAHGTLAVYLTLRDLAAQSDLDAFAVRCWPEFFTELGCAACGALSMLSDQMTPCGCEADVNGTLTQLILQWISGEPAFGADVVSIDPESDAVVVWHCGLAPASMADGVPGVTIHSNRKLPLLMEFPLRPGRVTVARLSQASGAYRLVVGSGEMLRAPLAFSGTSGHLRFDGRAADVVDTILSEGLEHHLSITYGDYVPALLALARMLDLPVLHL